MQHAEVRIGVNYRGIGEPSELANNLDDSVWVDCEFRECQLSGAGFSGAVFANCQFNEVILYWCMAFRATFIGCRFAQCDLRGAFSEARFVRCEFVKCEVGDNNLGGTTEWEDAVAVECVVSGPPLPIV